MRVSSNFNAAIIANSAEPGPTPLTDSYEASTPRKHTRASTTRSQGRGRARRWRSMSHRQPAQARNATVIQTGRNCTCGASENASAARVQGKLASSDPSVPVRLTIHVAPIEYGERLQAGVAMRLAVRRRELGARYAHAVVTVCPVCVDYPTRHH